MGLYLDLAGNIHDDMEGRASQFLPDGCVSITQAEADLKLAQKAAETRAKLSYAELRAAEYPPMQDYLDGIVNGDKVQIQNYIDACLLVKAKYPKPIK